MGDTPGFAVHDLGLQGYRAAYALQRNLHANVATGKTAPTLLLLEHPDVITHGRKNSRDSEDTNILASRELLENSGIEVISTERGGSVTYHGPGQLVGYPIFPVGRRVRDFLRSIETAIIQVLAVYGVTGRANPGYAGVYVPNPDPSSDGFAEHKIASIGVAVQQGVALHGFALNVSTDLRKFDLIRPCGLSDTRMTSLERILGRTIEMDAVKAGIIKAFADVFNTNLNQRVQIIRTLEAANA